MFITKNQQQQRKQQNRIVVSYSSLLSIITMFVGYYSCLLILCSSGSSSSSSIHVSAFTVLVPVVSPSNNIKYNSNKNHYYHYLGSKYNYKNPSATISLSKSQQITKSVISSFQLHVQQQNNFDPDESVQVLVGDDSAYFNIKEQSIVQWIQFLVAVGAILSFISYIWFLPFGLHGGDIFLNTIQNNDIYTTSDPALTVSIMLIVFAIAHSGLAGLRTYVEPIIGSRLWRVIFATVSLPLSLSCISYFINHVHEGNTYWNIIPSDHSSIEYIVLHSILYSINFISFLFLYPSTFDLLSIAAINKPILRLWETGIIRITRHPQAFGQLLWCIGHTIYFGTSTAVAASLILLAHHAFACYHGDRRLQYIHGDNFTYIKNKTSIVPFAAILDGRQVLPNDYYKEFLRLPYLLVIIGTTAAYFAHPYFLAGAALLHW